MTRQQDDKSCTNVAKICQKLQSRQELVNVAKFLLKVVKNPKPYFCDLQIRLQTGAAVLRRGFKGHSGILRRRSDSPFVAQ